MGISIDQDELFKTIKQTLEAKVNGRVGKAMLIGFDASGKLSLFNVERIMAAVEKVENDANVNLTKHLELMRDCGKVSVNDLRLDGLPEIANDDTAPTTEDLKRIHREQIAEMKAKYEQKQMIRKIWENSLGCDG